MTITKPGVYRDRYGREHVIVRVDTTRGLRYSVESQIGDTWTANGQFFVTEKSRWDLIERAGDLP